MALFSKPTARTLAIIDLLMTHPQQCFGLTDITRRLQLNKATCHAILSTMKDYGFLYQDAKTKAYRLGPSMAAVGHAAYSQYPSLSHAKYELEALSENLNLDCSAVARSNSDLVTLAHYQNPSAAKAHTQTGLRLPNIAPLGACFIAWSPVAQLQHWIEQAHSSQGGYKEQLDQQMRISVLSIYKRGFEVTLITGTEAQWNNSLSNINNHSSRSTEQHTQRYQQALCQQNYHLSLIDPQTSYDVSKISVPVFGFNRIPELTLSVSSFDKRLTGAEIENIADVLKLASQRVTKATKASLPFQSKQA